MIKLENIYKRFGEGNTCVEALAGLSLDVNRGEFLAVMGASGSGKSTLLNILGAMDKASEGTYLFEDTNVSLLGMKELHKFRKEHISFVFQQFSLLGRYTVYENTEIPLIARGVPAGKRKEMIMHALQMVGIEHLKDKKPVNISGGEQQRCAIARAIVVENDLLLADEPTGALDKRNGEGIMDIFCRLNKEGKTIVMVTHDEKIASYASRIIKIEDGRVIG